MRYLMHKYSFHEIKYIICLVYSVKMVIFADQLYFYSNQTKLRINNEGQIEQTTTH